MSTERPKFPAAANAWLDIRPRLLGTSTFAQVRILDKYFMLDKHKPAPEPEYEFRTVRIHSASRFGEDQVRCRTCGKVWDANEPPPECK